ncbi:MAG: hypothetical protein BA864_11020 [Desulfuromonadales bacterium C00003093]|nr:MAG: hypothetical protein BA864_11020 [Desulfuromonadales bacterium C00003093]
MNSNQMDELTRKGIEAAEEGDIHMAQVFLQQVAEHRNAPTLHTYLAYCLACSQGRMHSAAKVCRESIKREPNNSLHYLILGRVLLLAGEKGRAIKTFRQGLKTSPNPKIIEELKKLGLRKPAVIKNLKRENPLNWLLGKVFNIIGLR